MKKVIIGLWIAFLAGTALGWSEDWDNYDPTNDFGKPTGRMFMELVWAVNERIAAAKSAGCDHFVDSGGRNVETIFPGTPGNIESYIGIQTNWSDEIGDFVAQTCALYRAEFWEPNIAQVDQLVEMAYEALSYFMPANPDSFTNRFYSYVGATNADPNVPVWVYHKANVLGNYINGTNYGPVMNVWNQPETDVAMHMPWPSNPIAIMGGSMKYAGVSNNIPVYFVDYPIHESPPGKTLTNQLLNLYTIRECEMHGTPWELRDDLASGTFWGTNFYNQRSEMGTYECGTLEIRWEATNGWWTNSSFTFEINRAMTTNFSFYVYEDRTLEEWVAWGGTYWRYLNGIVNLYELYPTNTLTVSGTLPMSISCSNFVPVNAVMIAGNLFTGIVPNVSAKMTGIRPTGNSSFGLIGGYFRGRFSDWNQSASRLFKIKEIIDLYGSNTVANAGASLLKTSYWSTNSGAYWNDPDHIQCWDCLFPVGYGTNSTYWYTNYSSQGYDYGSHSWGPAGAYGWPHGSGLSDIEAARLNATCHLISDSGSFGGYRKSNIYCANIEVSPTYIDDRLPTDDGYPYIESVDYYLSLTNQVHDYYDGFVTNSRTYYGTATYTPTNPIYNWYYGTYMPNSSMVFNINDQWMTDLNATSEYAWAKGPYSCEGSTNETTKSLNAMIKFSVSGIAKWRFSTNFDAYWDMYPACTNAP